MRKKNSASHKGQTPWQKQLGDDHPDVIKYKQFLSFNTKKIRNKRKDWGTTLGYTNEYRIANGMKTLSGKPKGSKEKESTRQKKSEAQKMKMNIRNLLTGEYKRVNKDIGYEMIKTGLWGASNKGRKIKGHSEESKSRFREIALNRPIHHCDVCNRNIQGNMNWDRHLVSAKHLSLIKD